MRTTVRVRLEGPAVLLTPEEIKSADAQGATAATRTSESDAIHGFFMPGHSSVNTVHRSQRCCPRRYEWGDHLSIVGNLHTFWMLGRSLEGRDRGARPA